MPTYTYTEVRYRCTNCHTVIAVNPRMKLGNPFGNCPHCGQPIVLPNVHEWQAYTSRERFFVYLGILLLYSLPALLYLLFVGGYGGIFERIGDGLRSLDRMRDDLFAGGRMTVSGLLAVVGISIGFLRLWYRVRQSNARVADPIHRAALQDKFMLPAEPPPAAEGRFACMVGLMLVGVSGLILSFLERDFARADRGLLMIPLLYGVVLTLGGLARMVFVSAAQFQVSAVVVCLVATVGVVGGLVALNRPWNDQTIDGPELSAVLGKRLDEPAVKDLLAPLGEGRVTVIGGKQRREWPDRGIILELGDDATVETIYLGSTKRYRGPLPHGLAHGNSPDEVRKTLGDPDASADIQFGRWAYADKGLLIEWRDGRIQMVRIHSREALTPFPAATLLALPGKNRQSAEYRALREKLKIEPEKGTIGADTYERWKSKGIELRFAPDGDVRVVELYRDGTRENQRYKGELPYQLAFFDSGKSVQQKLSAANGFDRVLCSFDNRDGLEFITIIRPRGK